MQLIIILKIHIKKYNKIEKTFEELKIFITTYIINEYSKKNNYE